MTLTKAIEALREISEMTDPKHTLNGIWALGVASKALAALPAKPMTEDEIVCVINPYLPSGDGVLNTATAKNIIRALKSAGVLFVKED